jgi:nicotinate-nucleotide adenylyltransferase
MQRMGLLGGTFDPVHYGHLAIAAEAAWALNLAHIYLVPAAYQPLKHGQHSASPQQRLHMLQLACADDPLLIPSDMELRRAPPSYTVDTLRELRATLAADCELWFVLGSDSLMTLPRWHAAADILHLARLAAMQRPGSRIDLTPLDAALPGLRERTTVIQGPALDISSSELRWRIAHGRPVRYQIPEPVRAYIREQGLYRPAAPRSHDEPD